MVESLVLSGHRRVVRRTALVFLSIIVILAVAARAVHAVPGDTTRESVDSSGNQANNDSYWAPSLSADGRYVAFTSIASNLVPNDTRWQDIFVRDRQTGAIERVSVDSSGTEENGNASSPSISADGRYVAFVSDASNLVPNDYNGTYDVFVHDRQTGTTERVSVNSRGAEGNWFSGSPSISADGRYVVFQSRASNLSADDTSDRPDIFVRDRQAGTTELASVGGPDLPFVTDNQSPSISADGRYVVFNSDVYLAAESKWARHVVIRDRESRTTELVSVDDSGALANQASYTRGGFNAVSADGRYVVFESAATNLVTNDSNGSSDVFVHDREMSTTEMVNVSSSGKQSIDGSDSASISADGNYIAFQDDASNLVSNDTNRDRDVFVRDQLAGTTSRVSVNSSGTQGNWGSMHPAISANGRFAAFVSEATNLVPDDTNGVQDVFVHEMNSNTIGQQFDSSGGTLSTDNGDGTTASDPVDASVTTPVAGAVYITESKTNEPGPVGYALLGQQVNITAAQATPENPLVLRFTLDSSVVAGQDQNTIEVFRNGALVENCADQSGTASPNPCVSARNLLPDGDVEFTVLTSAASHWNFGVDKAPPRVEGVSPGAGEAGVDVGTNPTATFSEEMKPSTLTSSTVKLQVYNKKKGKWQAVSAVVTPSADGRTVTLDPYGTTETSLAARKKYKVLITTGVQDRAGNRMASTFSWTFTTAGP